MGGGPTVLPSLRVCTPTVMRGTSAPRLANSGKRRVLTSARALTTQNPIPVQLLTICVMTESKLRVQHSLILRGGIGAYTEAQSLIVDVIQIRILDKVANGQRLNTQNTFAAMPGCGLCKFVADQTPHESLAGRTILSIRNWFT